MKNNINESLNDICKKVISKCKLQYHMYQDNLTLDFYSYLEKKLPKYYKNEFGISPDIYLMIISNNLINKKLCELSKDGNIDIEISLIERYSNLLNFIMKKMGYTYEEYEKKGEDILIEAIETYDGVKTFSIHIVNCIRKKKENKCKSQYINKSNITKELTIEDKINNYLNEHEIIKEQPNYLEMVCHNLNIINKVNIENSKIKDFLYLKYGYYENIYFKLEQISAILDIDIEEIKQYYKNSLIILKDVTNNYIDKVNSCDIEIDNHKNYIISTKKTSI